MLKAEIKRRSYRTEVILDGTDKKTQAVLLSLAANYGGCVVETQCTTCKKGIGSGWKRGDGLCHCKVPKAKLIVAPWVF